MISFSVLLLIAGFSVLCLSGCVGTLIIAQRLLKRAFDMVNFIVGYIEHHEHVCNIDRPEVLD